MASEKRRRGGGRERRGVWMTVRIDFQRPAQRITSKLQMEMIELGRRDGAAP